MQEKLLKRGSLRKEAMKGRKDRKRRERTGVLMKREEAISMKRKKVEAVKRKEVMKLLLPALREEGRRMQSVDRKPARRTQE